MEAWTWEEVNRGGPVAVRVPEHLFEDFADEGARYEFFTSKKEAQEYIESFRQAIRDRPDAYKGVILCDKEPGYIGYCDEQWYYAEYDMSAWTIYDYTPEGEEGEAPDEVSLEEFLALL